MERGKKLRQVLREKGLLHHFLQHHRYDIGAKFPHAFPNGTEVATEPLLNSLDVSIGFSPPAVTLFAPSCPHWWRWTEPGHRNVPPAALLEAECPREDGDREG